MRSMNPAEGSVAPVVSPTEVDESVVASILVARLGEADMRNWWASRSFGAAGRVVLKQRLPRTWRMAAVELDLASATNRHNELMSRPNAVHLFSDHWPVRRWAAAWVSEQKTAQEADPLFKQLESATLEEIEQLLGGDGHARAQDTAGAVRIGSIDHSALTDHASIAAAVRDLVSGYVGSESFVVPYFEVVG